MIAERIYRRHLTALQYCASGCRAFFHNHGFDWGKFLREGIEREKFVSTNDAMAIKAVKLADSEDG